MAPVTGSPARTILESTREEDATLIVVGTSRKKAIERFMLGSVAENVLGDVDRDVPVTPTRGSRSAGGEVAWCK